MAVRRSTEAAPGDLLVAAAAERPSPVAIAQAIARRIGDLPEDANVFIECDVDRLLAGAREAERRLGAGEGRPLEGLPLAVKDIVVTEGFQTTAGSRARVAIPTDESPVVAALRDAGAIPFATTNMTEYAFGIHGRNAWYGDVARPGAPGLLAGGSSSGSAAAVAWGVAAAAIGTDTGGSIRIPAASCGVVGYKPAYGSLSTRGVVPLAPSCDHVGLFTATVPALDPLLAVLDQPVAGSRMPDVIAVPAEQVGPYEPALRARYLAAVDALDAREDPAALPPDELDEAHGAYHSLLFGEAMEIHGETLRRTPEDYGPDLRRLPELDAAAPLDLQAARAYLRRYRATLIERLGEGTVLLTPATRIPAPPARGDEVELEGVTIPLREAQNRYIAPFSFAGLPAIVVPAGAIGGGLDAAVQLVAAPGAEDRLLCAAAAVERALTEPD